MSFAKHVKTPIKYILVAKRSDNFRDARFLVAEFTHKFPERKDDKQDNINMDNIVPTTWGQ